MRALKRQNCCVIPSIRVGALRCRHGALCDLASLRPLQTQIFSHPSGARVNQLVVCALCQDVFGHGAVRRPFTARHCHQATATHQDRMLTTDRLGVFTIIGLRFH